MRVAMPTTSFAPVIRTGGTGRGTWRSAQSSRCSDGRSASLAAGDLGALPFGGGERVLLRMTEISHSHVLFRRLGRKVPVRCRIGRSFVVLSSRQVHRVPGWYGGVGEALCSFEGCVLP